MSSKFTLGVCRTGERSRPSEEVAVRGDRRARGVFPDEWLVVVRPEFIASSFPRPGDGGGVPILTVCGNTRFHCGF